MRWNLVAAASLVALLAIPAAASARDRHDRNPYPPQAEPPAQASDREVVDPYAPDPYAPDPYAYDPNGYEPAPPPVAPVIVTGRGDPWEGMNRRLYSVNNGLDRAVIRPVSMTYKRVLPRPVRTGVRNVLDNLGEPVVFMNDALQGRFVPAGRTATRFVTNTTVGVGGLFDVATKAGVPAHDNDFGVTMGRYHVPEGPYLFLPVLGPTTVRDGFGRIVDAIVSPLNFVGLGFGARAGMAGAKGADTRAELDPEIKALRAGATDEYSTVRSLYLQNRSSRIKGQAAAVQALPDFGDEPAMDEAPAPEQVSTADQAVAADSDAATPPTAHRKHHRTRR